MEEKELMIMKLFKQNDKLNMEEVNEEYEDVNEEEYDEDNE